MTSKLEQLQNMLTPVVEALGYTCWGIEFISQGRHSVLRIYIDHEDGIVVDDCETVSRQLSAVLDVEDPISSEYTLEVSSPGVDRPLFTLEQFQRHLGESAKVVLKLPQDGRRRLQGEIAAIDGEQEAVTFIVDGKPLVTAFDNIDKARIIPDWAALGLAPTKPTGPAPKQAGKAKKKPSNESAAGKPRAE